MSRFMTGFKSKLHIDDNRGSTMVEVLVGFTILVMILVECMVHIVGVSSEMIEKSVDMQNDQTVLNRALYQKDTDYQTIEDDSGKPVGLILTIDQEKTNVTANQTNTNAKLWLDAKLQRYVEPETEITIFRLLFDPTVID